MSETLLFVEELVNTACIVKDGEIISEEYYFTRDNENDCWEIWELIDINEDEDEGCIKTETRRFLGSYKTLQECKDEALKHYNENAWIM